MVEKDPIRKKIIENNKEIERAVIVYEMMQTDGFKIFYEWLNNHHTEWDSAPISQVKDEEHLKKLQGGIMYGEEINAQLAYWERKSKEETKEPPKA